MRIVLLAILLSTYSTYVQAQAPVFPARGAVIVDTLVGQYPTLAHGDDDQRRALTRMICQQFQYEFPGQGYGSKAQAIGYPPSKDAIARLVNGHLWGWDWQNGASRTRQVHVGQPAMDLSGQAFLDVGAVDHLHLTPPVPELPPLDPAPSFDLSPVLEGQASLQAQMTAEATAAAGERAKAEAERTKQESFRQQVAKEYNTLKQPLTYILMGLAGLLGKFAL